MPVPVRSKREASRSLSPARKRTKAGNTGELAVVELKSVDSLNVPSIPPRLQLFIWGSGDDDQFGLGPHFLLEDLEQPTKHPYFDQQLQAAGRAGLKAIAGGGMNSLFLDESGKVWSCGVNDTASLGRVTEQIPDPSTEGSFIESSSIPCPLQSLIDDNFHAVQISAGDSIGAALSNTGELRIWGALHSIEGPSFLPYQILPALIVRHRVASAACGNNHFLILSMHGKVHACGSGEVGQLGRKILAEDKLKIDPSPDLVALARRAVLVAAGGFHSFAVDDHGDVWGWGLNNMGQTGTGYIDTSPATNIVPLPAKVLRISPEELGNGARVVEIQGGDQHSVFLTSDGRVYACGLMIGGRLGVSEDEEALSGREHPDFMPEPVLVKFPGNARIVRIAVGIRNNIAITESGDVMAWGEGTTGQLGIPGVSELKTPRRIIWPDSGLWEAVDVACGGQHTLALLRERT
ncbi:regulator of chromosome condensation 1/beta-lactamase-inhibitor protein II [Mycena floridula]|nr:regulator of chromosome condensation 1/beta-lactamase-inhibitor protein II [Mycena floridula]